MADLKTDYKDDVLDTEVNELRKYQMIQNEDGTVSFVDVTEYLQVGDSFGSADVNAITEKIKTQFVSDVNVLEIEDVGTYWVSNGSGLLTNMGATGFLEVIPHPNDKTYRTIRWTKFGSSTVYQNTMSSGVWHGWRALANVKTISGTTDASGNIAIGNFTNNGDNIPLSAVCTTPGYYVGRMFLNSVNIWYAQIYSVSTKAPVTSGMGVTVYANYVN